MEITSKDFQPQRDIPARFACDGENISPQLSWKGAPAATKSFVLIVHDPDAPRAGGYTHWVLYNIPNSVTQISQNIAKTENVPQVGNQGKNDKGDVGYTGPCPPSGTHRYYFHLYALDTILNLSPGATKADLEKAMKGHILAEGELMGKYKRSGSKAA